MVTCFRLFLQLCLASLVVAYPRSVKPKIHYHHKLIKHGHPWEPTLPPMDNTHFMSKLNTLMFLKHMATKNPRLAPMLAAAPRASIPAAMDVFNSAVNDLTEIAQSAIPNMGSLTSLSPTYNTINNIMSGDIDRSSVLQEGADVVRNMFEASGRNLGIAAAMSTLNNVNRGGFNTSVNNIGVNSAGYLPNNDGVHVLKTPLSGGGSPMEFAIAKSNSTSGPGVSQADLNSNNGHLIDMFKPEMNMNANGQTSMKDNRNTLDAIGMNGVFKPKSFGAFTGIPFDTDTGGIPVSTNVVTGSNIASKDLPSRTSLPGASRGVMDQSVGVSHDIVVKPIGTSPEFIIQPISAEFPISQIGSMDISLRDFQATRLAKDISSPFEVPTTMSGKSMPSVASSSHPKIKVYNPFTNRLQPEAFGPGPYHECTPPARVVCGARIDWNHVIGMTSWCKKNCVVFNYSSYCDDNRCQCKCETPKPSMRIQ